MTYVGFFIIFFLLWNVVFLRHEIIYKTAIASIPFSATAIFNYEGKGFPAPIFITLVWMITFLGSRINYRFKREQLNYLALVFLLLITIFSSKLFSLLTANQISNNCIIARDNFKPFASAYLLFWLTFSCMFMIKNKNISSLKDTLKICFYSGVFACVWGIFQWVSYRLVFAYPTFFNNSESPYSNGYTGSFAEIGVSRISSVAVEPSVFAQYLLFLFPIVYMTVFFKKPIISVKFDFFLLFLILINLILSGSATAYIGFLVCSFFIISSVNSNMKSLIKFLSLGSCILALIYFSPLMKEIIYSQTYHKIESFSFNERLNSIEDSLACFFDSPIYGFGWGQLTSHDLAVNVLANSGIMGFLAFCLFIGFVFFKLRAHLKRIDVNTAQYVWGSGVYISFVSFLCISQLSGFGYVFGTFWLLTGLAFCFSFMIYKK